MNTPLSSLFAKTVIATLLSASAALAHAAPLVPGTTGVKIADYIMATWPNLDATDCGYKCFSLNYATVPAAPNPKYWEYTNTVPLWAMWKLYEKTGNVAYYNYVKKFVDTYVDANGVISYQAGASTNDPRNQDVIQPANLLFGLYEKTGDQRYLKAMISVRGNVDLVQKNPAGAFYHKPNYPNQQWLDGIYMTQPFLVRYAAKYGDAVKPGDAAVAYNIATNQIKLAHDHLFNADKKLHYHAWNGAPDGVWLGLNHAAGRVPPLDGQRVSPMLWSRSIAWYITGIVDVLEFLPRNHPDRNRLTGILSYIADGLTQQQDTTTGLWYQVTDVRNNKLPANGGYPGEAIPGQPNWHETSSSALFAYSLAKAARLGLLDDGYKAVAKKAWNGIKASKVTISGSSVTVKHTVVGMSVGGTYNAYVNADFRTDLATGQPPAPPAQCSVVPPKFTSWPLNCKFLYVRDNVPQGLGAVMMAATELEF